MVTIKLSCHRIEIESKGEKEASKKSGRQSNTFWSSLPRLITENSDEIHLTILFCAKFNRNRLEIAHILLLLCFSLFNMRTCVKNIILKSQKKEEGKEKDFMPPAVEILFSNLSSTFGSEIYVCLYVFED